MAHPYLILEPKASSTVDVTPYFRGFTKTPVYSVTANSTVATATIDGTTITVKAKNRNGVGSVIMKVTDGDGTTFEQLLNIAVSGTVEPMEGDVNGDGEVNVGDIMAVINIMAAEETDLKGDVNGDNAVNVGDIMAIINIMALIP
jgi:hypothetical protein